MKRDASSSTSLRFVLAAVGILLGIGPADAAEKIRVVATFSVIGDLVANVAGDRVDLVTLVGPAGDTELFTVAPTSPPGGASGSRFLKTEQ